MRCSLCLVLVLVAACSPSAVDPAEVPHTDSEVTESGTSATTVPEVGPRDPEADPPQDSNARIITLFIHEQRVDCHGEMPQKCLQIREQPTEEWSYFYDSIAGFEYEESYRYELRVAVSTNENPPADASSLSYRLVEVVSKQRVGGDPPPAVEQ